MRGKVLIRYFEKLMRCKMWDHEIFKDGFEEEEVVDGWLWFDKKRDKHCFILYHTNKRYNTQSDNHKNTQKTW